MPYRCPVCEAIQADAEHLAHHLALTATLHGRADDAGSTDPHAAWLSAHAAGWASATPADLASRVAEHVEPVEEVAEVEEPARDERHSHQPAAGPSPERVPEGIGGDRGELDEDAARILEEARELTERMESESKEE